MAARERQCESLLCHRAEMMMKGLLPLSELFFQVVLLQSANAATPGLPEQRILCPREMPAESLPVALAPAGWVASSRGGLDLHAVDISDGPPARMAFLKPESIKMKNGKGADRWTDLDIDLTEGAWIACNYGNSDQVILGKQLNKNLSECTAIYTKNKFGSYDIEVLCKQSASK